MLLSKTQVSSLFQTQVLGPLLKNRLPLMKNVFKPIAKSVLVPLELTPIASAKDPAIHKKMFGSGMRPLDLAK